MKLRWIILVLAILVCGPSARAAGASSASKMLDKPAEWYKSDEATKAAANVLSFQSPLGGFPKNIDTAAKPYTGEAKDLHPTYDNSATTDELRFLARMYEYTKDEKYHDAFMKGLDYVLKAQYPNGGWPQSSPPDAQGYGRYITFNDGCMVRLMFFLKEVAEQDHYKFVDADRRKACVASWDKGIDCILKCQIRVDGKLTAWCAQHDG